MQPELSRRAGRVMSTPTMMLMDLDERVRFVDTVAHAESFNDLPSEYQDLIVQVEQEFDIH